MDNESEYSGTESEDDESDSEIEEVIDEDRRSIDFPRYSIFKNSDPYLTVFDEEGKRFVKVHKQVSNKGKTWEKYYWSS